MKITYNFAPIPNNVLREGIGAINIAILAALIGHGITTATAETIAHEIGCSRSSVFEAVGFWIKNGGRYGIEIKTEPKLGMPTKYEVIIKPTRPAGGHPPSSRRTPPVQPADTGVSSRRTQKKTTVKKTTKEDKERTSIAAHSAAVVSGEDGGVDPKQIAEVLDVFKKSVNPMINFGNKAQRSAAADLIRTIGFDKTMISARFACTSQGKEFAPTITTPCQLREKLGALRAYFARQSRKGKKNTRIKIS